MGKAKYTPVRDSSLPGYRDDPDAVSLHATPEAYHDDFDEAAPSSSGGASDEQLPSYEHSEAVEATARENEERADGVAGIPDNYAVIDFNNVGRFSSGTSSGRKKSTSNEVTSIMDERLADPHELFRYVSDYLQWMPPRPIVWIEGWHWATRRDGNGKKKRDRETDFEIMLSLQPYLGQARNADWRRPHVVEGSEDTYRGSWRKTREAAFGASENAPDLRAWCNTFCSDPGKLKVFRVSRTVTGIDQDYIKGAVETLVRRLDYRGHIETKVVVENRAVDIYSEHWVNRWRTSWVRWIFYLTFLWILTWPLLFFRTRRWRVFTVDWPFSLPWPERSDGAKRYATISERDWFLKHEILIENLVIEGFKGNATQMPLNVARRANTRGGRAAGAPSTGNANVDGAMDFIQAGLGSWNALQRGLNGRGGEGYGWGYDE